MKNIILFMMALLFSGLPGFSQQKNVNVVKLRGTRLTYPLVNKWIAEFNKEYPLIKLSIAVEASADSIDFRIASCALTAKELEGNRDAVVVTRYVQLPIVNSKRTDLAELRSTGLTGQNLGDIFFNDETPAFLSSSSNVQTPLVYVRDRPVCAVKAFAAHFGADPKEINGTGITGDDEDLGDALRKDANGLSFNNLGFIYDVKSRKITGGLAVVPLDLNENGKVGKDEEIYSTLDHVIDFIENTHHPKFVNEPVNFIFSKDSKNTSAGIFLKWILTRGQKFNHELGFMSLDHNFLSDQAIIASSTFKANSASSCEGANELMRERKSKITNN